MRTVSFAMVFLLMTSGEPAAHRLDEYLQAARVSLERDRITLEVDLTPGASVASAIISLLDRDGDSTISPTEAAAYGQVVLTDLVLQFDDRPVSMTLARVEIPSTNEIRDGVGTIQLRAVGNIETDVVGRRHLYFRNNHQPAASVYLVNALIPEDGDVGVLGQTRDHRQQGVRVEYNVGPRWPAQLLWLVLCGAGLSALIALRKGSERQNSTDVGGGSAASSGNPTLSVQS